MQAVYPTNTGANQIASEKVRLLRLLNVLAGLNLCVLGLCRLPAKGQRTGFILLATLLVASPVEDFLVHRLVPDPPVGDRTYQIIDQGTSLVLILGMIVTTLLR